MIRHLFLVLASVALCASSAHAFSGYCAPEEDIGFNYVHFLADDVAYLDLKPGDTMWLEVTGWLDDGVIGPHPTFWDSSAPPSPSKLPFAEIDLDLIGRLPQADGTLIWYKSQWDPLMSIRPADLSNPFLVRSPRDTNMFGSSIQFGVEVPNENLFVLGAGLSVTMGCAARSSVAGTASLVARNRIHTQLKHTIDQAAAWVAVGCGGLTIVAGIIAFYDPEPMTKSAAAIVTIASGLCAGGAALLKAVNADPYDLNYLVVPTIHTVPFPRDLMTGDPQLDAIAQSLWETSSEAMGNGSGMMEAIYKAQAADRDGNQEAVLLQMNASHHMADRAGDLLMAESQLFQQMGDAVRARGIDLDGVVVTTDQIETLASPALSPSIYAMTDRVTNGFDPILQTWARDVFVRVSQQPELAGTPLPLISRTVEQLMIAAQAYKQIAAEAYIQPPVLGVPPLIETQANASCQAVPAFGGTSTNERLEPMDCTGDPAVITALGATQVGVTCRPLFDPPLAASAIVLMRDLTPPIAQPQSVDPIECGEVVDLHPLATDNCSEFVSSFCAPAGILPVGTYSESCLFRDLQHNETQASMTVVVEDRLPPALNSLAVGPLMAGDRITLSLSQLVTATDQCVGTIDVDRLGAVLRVDFDLDQKHAHIPPPDRPVITGSTVSFRVPRDGDGSVTLWYTVSDGNGNQTTGSTTIPVLRKGDK